VSDTAEEKQVAGNGPSASAATLAPPAPFSVKRKSITECSYCCLCVSRMRAIPNAGCGKGVVARKHKVMTQLRAQSVPPYNDHQSRNKEAIATPTISLAEAAAASAHTARDFVVCTRARCENVSVCVFEFRLFSTYPYSTIQFLEHGPSQTYITNTVYATRS
jgi:hypothetical protein